MIALTDRDEPSSPTAPGVAPPISHAGFRWHRNDSALPARFSLATPSAAARTPSTTPGVIGLGAELGRFGARVALAAAGRISDSAFGWDSFRWHRKHAWIARHGMDIASWQEADQPRHTRGSATAPNPHGAKRDRRHWPGGRASTSLAAQANEERYP
jgi:hypothetical protein